MSCSGLTTSERREAPGGLSSRSRRETMAAGIARTGTAGEESLRHVYHSVSQDQARERKEPARIRSARQRRAETGSPSPRAS